MQRFESPLAILKKRAEENGEMIAFRVLRWGSESFSSLHAISRREFYEKAESYAAYFQSLGFGPGTRIAIWAKNSADWLAVDYAIMSAGFVSVPLYPQSCLTEIQGILDESECRLLLTDEVHEDIGCPQIQLSDLPSIAKIFAGGFIQPPLRFENLATIVYTSGTNGKPKGVMHSMQNGFLAIASANQRIQMNESDILFSYLPLSHIAERILVQWGSLVTGACVTVIDRVERLFVFLAQARPTIFLGVPRIWEMLAKRISTMENQNILTALGFDRVRLFISGAAKLNPEIGDYLFTCGIPICEGYGLTETMGVTSINDAYHRDSVGRPFPGVEWQMASDGEIVVRAPFHFLGYYRAPDQTDDVMRDGWFHTGDIGHVESDRCLTITDRKKNLFKSSNGKYIAPQPIESLLRKMEGIREVLVVGEGRPYCVAIANVSEDFQNEEGLLAHLKSVNAMLAPHEQIKAIGCIRGLWSVDSGEMTPTYKLKRRIVLERFQPQIAELFESSRFLCFF